MEISVIIIICGLLLIAYTFDITSSKTKIPSVILLLLLGWVTRQIFTFYQVNVPELKSLLPVIGTIGLILIVLEGSLELEIDITKKDVIRKSIITSLIPLIVLSLILATTFKYYNQCSFQTAMMNALPFCVISSAMAVPSVQSESSKLREFVIFESSLSDIFGVLFFNFVVLNEVIGVDAVSNFIGQILFIVLISFFGTLGLSYLLNKIRHHIKFTPIILTSLLIYALAKTLHLPALIFVMIFGLFLGNLILLRHFSVFQSDRLSTFIKEVENFKDFTFEITFVVRALFFILFGFTIENHELLNLNSLEVSVFLILLIYLVRLLHLLYMKLPVLPLILIAPRGLITILLFFAIPVGKTIGIIDRSVIIQVVIISALLMMVGLMIKRDHSLGSIFHKDKKDTMDKTTQQSNPNT